MTPATRTTYDVAIPLLGVNASGGVGMVIHVANALAARGHRVVLGVPRGSPAASIAFDARVTLAPRPPGPAAFVASLPRARVQVATGYKTPVLIACGALLRAQHPALFYLIQGDEPASHIALGPRPAWMRPALILLARAGYRLPATRIAVSSFVADRVGRALIRRVIPPGIEAAFLASPPPRRAAAGPRTVGVIAHPARAKGVRFALDAFAALATDRDVRCTVLDDACTIPLPASVTPYSRLDAVTGRDIFGFYAACDVFVFPSLVEGFGLPPLEAMARGAAVVVSDSGGVREYARDGENCLMVRPGSADEIVRAVRRLVTDDTLRVRLCVAGRQTAERFTVERFAGECAAEIERLLGGGGPNS